MFDIKIKRRALKKTSKTGWKEKNKKNRVDFEE